MTTALRVAMVNLTRGGLSGGYRKYIQELTPLLAAHPAIEELRVFLPDRVGKLVPEAFAPGVRPIRTSLAGQMAVRREIVSWRPDVIFVPTARWLPFADIPTVVMVRNMEPLAAPLSLHSPRNSAQNVARRGAAWMACKRAARVIAVSRFVESFLRQTWKLPQERIGIVPHGVRRSDVSPERPASMSRVAEPFLFSAGSLRPYRGLEETLCALRHLRDGGLRCPLVVAGRADLGTEHYRRRLLRQATELDVVGDVLWLGQADSAQMTWCLANASGYLTTSRVEACPNTLLEAMSFGLPCISVRLPPMEEFLGSCGIYYEAGNAQGLSARMKQIVELDPADRTAIGEATARRASGFSWERTSEATVQQLQMAAEP